MMDIQRIQQGMKAVAFLAIFLVPVSAQAILGPAIAEIVNLKGVGQYRPENTQQWSSASVNQGLFPGNFVRTGDLSRMALLFIDQTQLSLNQNSQLQIKQVQDPQNKQDTTVRLNKGRSWTQSKQISNRLTMETPSATAAIRGTDWEMDVDESGKSTLTVLSGTVDFYNEQGRVTVNRNEQAIAEVGKAPVKIIISNPHDRVQWVSAYSVETLRHIYLHDDSVTKLRQELAGLKGGDFISQVQRGNIHVDLAQWTLAEQQYRAALEQQPDAAGALLGMAYVELHRGDVNKAESYFTRIPVDGERELTALGRVVALIQGGQFKSALDILQRLVATPELKQPAAYLILSDLMVYSGEQGKASELLQQARQRFPGNPRIASQLARVYLFSDQNAESQSQLKLALTQTPHIVDAYLNMGALARKQGDAKGAESAYLAAIALKPEDDRGWYGLGAVNSEREDIKNGRSDLNQALAINPHGAGYRGELATLETFANNFKHAEAEYGKALQDNPGDYVALTGRGLLELKRGNTQQALEFFLKASVIEPRYARVHMYTAVAYYQMDRVERALEELDRAKILDPKDPFPYMLASIIHGDYFESGKAIAEGREAMQRMPYLKSLNQIANDQKGTANLGSALAFFGLEEWAFNHAQESYSPFWGGSHLFLADRYPSLFNKNSELFQGYLVDPTAFGGSNRFQTLLPKPGNYFNAGVRYNYQEEMKAYQPYITANGYSNSLFPLAYFFDAGHVRLDPGTSAISADSTTLTAALGANPVHELGLFGFATQTDTDGKLGTFPVTYRADRVDMGGNYKFSPSAQLWIKIGDGKEKTGLSGHTPDGELNYLTNTDTREYQLRHSFALGDKTEFSWGYESASLETPQALAITIPSYPDNPVVNNITTKDRSRDAYISGRFSLSDTLLLQTDLFSQRYTKTADSGLGLVGYPETFDYAHNEHTEERINKRLGLVQHWGSALLRAAYQEWTRPASVSTLGSVTTAGIPVDAQLVSPGGRIVRSKAQMEWEWNPHTFSTLFFDKRRVKNGQVSDIQSSYLEGLDKLKGNRLINAASVDALEGTPQFNEGQAISAGAALNHILNPSWSIYSRYIYTDSELINDRSVEGFPIPYLARHQFILGTTWTGPRRLFINALAIWRGERYSRVERSEDVNNPNTYTDYSQKLHAGWDAGLRAYWETQDKHWSFDGVVANVFSKNNSTFYGIDAKYRF
ncbi:MAG: tetratricopeptide repeat protein [Sulfuricella denitrificans]|nr:tetratricopeptide repeat protein [Sulfuricella denitrificans]